MEVITFLTFQVIKVIGRTDEQMEGNLCSATRDNKTSFPFVKNCTVVTELGKKKQDLTKRFLQTMSQRPTGQDVHLG